MLKLPETWLSMNAGRIAIDFTRQVRGKSRRLVACKLIRAALDLLLDDIRFRSTFSATHPIKDEESACSWRVAETVYRYVPKLSDRSLLTWVTKRSDDELHLIVSPGKSWLVQAALSQQLGDRAPAVIGMDEFIASRLLLSSFDMRCSLSQIKTRWFQGYNRLLQVLDEKAEIAIDRCTSE